MKQFTQYMGIVLIAIGTITLALSTTITDNMYSNITSSIGLVIILSGIVSHIRYLKKK